MKTNMFSQAIAPSTRAPVPGERRPAAVVARHTGLAIDWVQSEAVVVRAREHERAVIASEGMENITALSAFEGHCIEMVPLAESRLRAVGDVFAAAVARAVAGYGR